VNAKVPKKAVRIRATGDLAKLAKEAQQLGGFKNVSEATNAALEEYIRRRKASPSAP
jgi:hypothetical protein